MALIRKLSVLVILVAAIGCKSADTTQQMIATCGGSFPGKASRYGPLNCIAVSGSTATPLIDPLYVYPHGRNGEAVKITWASSDPNADLHITMKDPSQGCVKSVACPRKQLCMATVVSTAKAGTQCEYLLSNGGGQPLDPIIIVDSCCPDPPQP